MTDIERQAAALPQFCPVCGAGCEGRTPMEGYGVIFHLPRNFPFDPPCAECDRRSTIQAQAIVARVTRECNDAFWRAFLDGATDTPNIVEQQP